MLIDPRTHWDLRNWAAWLDIGSNGGPPQQTSAASAEGRYVPDLGNLYEEQPPRRVYINADRAAVVDVVYKRMLRTDRRVAQVAQHEYPLRRNYVIEDRRGRRRFMRGRAAHELGIPMRIYIEYLKRFAAVVRNELGE